MGRKKPALNAKNGSGRGRPAARTGVADGILARAETAIEKLSAEYPGHASRDIDNLAALTARIAASADGPSDGLNEISRIAHDMRGQGAMFGYPLMTRCAGSLCRATRAPGPPDQSLVSVINAHIDALRAILDCRVTGGRDETGLAVAAGLEILVASRAGRRTASR